MSARVLLHSRSGPPLPVSDQLHDIWETPVEESSASRHLWAMDEQSPSKPPLTDAAKRALAEAAERRQDAANPNSEHKKGPSKELGGRKGPDPIRYGDWEKDGLISDF